MAWLDWKRGFAISKALEKVKANSFGISEEELSEAIKRERESEKNGLVASHRGPFQIPSSRKYFFQAFRCKPPDFIALRDHGFSHPLPLSKIRRIAQWLLEEHRCDRWEAEIYAEGIYFPHKGARWVRREELDEHALIAIAEVGFDTPFFFYSFYRRNRTIELAIPLRMKSMKRMSRYVAPYPFFRDYPVRLSDDAWG